MVGFKRVWWLTTKLTDERERVGDVRLRDGADSAPSHSVQRLVSCNFCVSRPQTYRPSIQCRKTSACPRSATAESTESLRSYSRFRFKCSPNQPSSISKRDGPSCQLVHCIRSFVTKSSIMLVPLGSDTRTRNDKGKSGWAQKSPEPRIGFGKKSVIELRRFGGTNLT